MTSFTSTRQVAMVTKLSPAFWRQALAPTVTMTAASSAVSLARLGVRSETGSMPLTRGRGTEWHPKASGSMHQRLRAEDGAKRRP
jgi:hypothetical protein